MLHRQNDIIMQQQGMPNFQFPKTFGSEQVRSVADLKSMANFTQRNLLPAPESSS